MIEQDDAEKAAQFIRDNAKSLAKSKSEKTYLENYKKSKKAILMQEVQGSGIEKETYAYAHKDYLIVLEALREATEEFERLHWLMVAAQTKISLYQTQEATNRMIDKVHT